MIAANIVKQRRRAGLALITWLLMTVFSCGALATMDADDSTIADAVDQHHMPAADQQTMQCCESVKPQISCCDSPIALINNTLDSSKFAELFDLPVMAASSGSEWEHPLRYLPLVIDTGHYQRITLSYPRLHLVHGTFLE